MAQAMSRGLAAVQVAPLRAACPEMTRFVMVTATLAAPVFAQLMQEFPGILPAFGPGERSHSKSFSCLCPGVTCTWPDNYPSC